MRKALFTIGLIATLTVLSGCHSKTGAEASQKETSKVQKINPDNILYPTPTIESFLPPLENHTDSSNLLIAEDNWRQVEFISKDQKEAIEKEMEKIRDIYNNYSDTSGGMMGFKRIEARDLISQPLSLDFATLTSCLSKEKMEIAGVTLQEDNQEVKNGFSFTINDIEYYGIKENDTVKVLCIFDTESSQQLKSSLDNLAGLLKTKNLYVMDWRNMKTFDETNIKTDFIPQ